MTEPRSLTLHVAGKDYTIPAPTMRVVKVLGALSAIHTARTKGEPIPAHAARIIAMHDKTGRAIEEDILGDDTYGQLFAADISDGDYQRLLRAATGWVLHGDDEKARATMAGDDIDGGGSGPKASTTTGEDGTTRKRSSTSGTTSRKGKKSS